MWLVIDVAPADAFHLGNRLRHRLPRVGVREGCVVEVTAIEKHQSAHVVRSSRGDPDSQRGSPGMPSQDVGGSRLGGSSAKQGGQLTQGVVRVGAGC